MTLSAASCVELRFSWLGIARGFMPNRNGFSDSVAAKIGSYVYRLIDPRNGTTFYVGRGRGNRVFEHAAGEARATAEEDSDVLKLKTIRAIRSPTFGSTCVGANPQKYARHHPSMGPARSAGTREETGLRR
jgi:hypothetical protein